MLRFHLDWFSHNRCGGSDDSVIFKLNRPNHRSLSVHEIDLYADYPAEPSHLISLSFSDFFCLFFFALIFSSRDFFFVSSVGGGCCDEDNKLPLLKALRTLAGRIEPINQLPPLSNCRPLHFFFLSLFLDFVLDSEEDFFWKAG